MTLFKEEDKDHKAFQFMNCWNKLQNQPKWHEKRIQMEDIKKQGNKKQKANMDLSPGTATALTCDIRTDLVIENLAPEIDAPQETKW